MDKPIFRAGEPRGDLLHSWNYHFTRSQSDLTKPAPRSLAPELGPFRNSYLFIYWEILTEKDAAGELKKLDPVFRSGMEWLIEHVKLHRTDKDEIKKKLSADRGD